MMHTHNNIGNHLSQNNCWQQTYHEATSLTCFQQQYKHRVVIVVLSCKHNERLLFETLNFTEWTIKEKYSQKC